MRRTFFFAFVLLVVSAVPAIASTAGSIKAHRRTTAHTRSSSHTGSRTTSRRTGAYQPLRSAVRKVRYTPKRQIAAPVASGANPAYSIGYQNGYDAGRADALKELQSQNSATNPGARPAQRVQPSSPPTHTAVPAISQQTPEPSDADPAAGPTTASQPAQFKPEALRSEHETESADAGDNTPTTEIATLEMPRAGMPISLRGSLASLQRQNTILESEGLERILDEDDLNSRIAHGLLAPLPASANLVVNPGLPENRRYCRSWTARFLSDLAKAHGAAFHRPFQVNSAVRTVEYQKHLRRTNGNAALAEGDIVSPHLTGATIDIGKQGMTRAELLWMRRTLFALQNAGKIDVEEEFEQACFHITVYKTYTTSRPAAKRAQPSVLEASAPSKSAAQAPRRGSSLPASIAAGALVPNIR